MRIANHKSLTNSETWTSLHNLNFGGFADLLEYTFCVKNIADRKLLRGITFPLQLQINVKITVTKQRFSNYFSNCNLRRRFGVCLSVFLAFLCCRLSPQACKMWSLKNGSLTQLETPENLGFWSMCALDLEHVGPVKHRKLWKAWKLHKGDAGRRGISTHARAVLRTSGLFGTETAKEAGLKHLPNSGVAPANQTKERAKTKSAWISPIFVNPGVFP